MKKNLLIFFGEYRTFERVIPQLIDLDKVDILICTWNTYTNYWKDSFSTEKVDVDKIKKILKNSEVLTFDDNFKTKKHPLWKMFWHWKTALNSIEDENKYDKVILKRCDCISDWHLLLERDFDKNTIYIDNGEFDGNKKTFWVGDYILAGDFFSLKNFVNLFNKENYEKPHYCIGDVILNHKINWKPLDIKSEIIRFRHTELFDYLNANGRRFLELPNNHKWKKIYHSLTDEGGR